MLTASEIERMFTRTDGNYVFARWGRPVCPVVFGVKDETLVIMKSAIEAVCIAAGHHTDELDLELGSNLMMFFFSDWEELRAVPDLDQMIPQLDNVVDRLVAAQANQYRAFRFDDQGAIQACFVFLRVDEALQQLGADSLALSRRCRPCSCGHKRRLKTARLWLCWTMAPQSCDLRLPPCCARAMIR